MNTEIHVHGFSGEILQVIYDDDLQPFAVYARLENYHEDYPVIAHIILEGAEIENFGIH